ncbi:MAG: hypothetical protein EBR94_01385 [Bacteroidetes bacterium]|jgi:hypothetical protein|nr:hypothetical protein [Bacteroidota bacterium]
MDKRLKKNCTIIATLLTMNVVGFFVAEAYFSSTSQTAHINHSVLFELFDLSPKMVAPSKWLEMGFELIKKMK